MKVKFNRHIATVAIFHEDEITGNIAKEIKEIEITGTHVYEASVYKQIPRECKLISHGVVTSVFEVDSGALLDFCKANGKEIK